MKPIGFWTQAALGILLLQHGCFSCELLLASPQQILEQIQSLFEVKTAVPAQAVPLAACHKGVKEKNAASKQVASTEEGGKVLSFPQAPLSTNTVQTNKTHDDPSPPRLNPILPKLPTKI